MTSTVVAYIVTTVVLNVVSAAAFGYLAAMTTAGARAGEDPWTGWTVAAFGSLLVIGSLAVLGISGLVEATPDTAGLKDNVVLGIESVFSVGFISLLAAFALGLPWLDPVRDDDDDEDHDEDDEVSGP